MHLLKKPRRFHAFIRAAEAVIPAIPAHESLGKRAFSCFSAEIDRSFILARVDFGAPQTTVGPKHEVAGLLPAVSVTWQRLSTKGKTLKFVDAGEGRRRRDAPHFGKEVRQNQRDEQPVTHKSMAQIANC